jgi:hypothetical protein
VLERSPEVVDRSDMILPPKALGCTLQAQGAKIKKLTGGLAHRADVAREWGRGNFSQRV